MIVRLKVVVAGVAATVDPVVVPVAVTVTVKAPALLLMVAGAVPPLPHPESDIAPKAMRTTAKREPRLRRRRNAGRKNSIARVAPPPRVQLRSSSAFWMVSFACAVVEPMVTIEVAVPPAVRGALIEDALQLGGK